MDMVGESMNTSTPQLSDLATADLVINGTLIETKLSIYGKVRFTNENSISL